MFDLSLYLRPGDGHIFGSVSDKLTHLELGHISSRMMTQLLTPTEMLGQDSNRVTTTMLQNVQQLRLSVDCITDDVVKAISKSLTSLIDLDIRDAPLQDPRQLSDLTDFGLHEINQNDAGFKTILHSCASLSKFSIYHGPKLTDLVFHDISATTLTLSHISLRRYHLLNDHTIRKLASSLKLENLDLRECRNLRDVTLKAVSHLPKLKVLLLYGTDVAFKWLKNPFFPRLKWLGITGSVNRDMVDALARRRPRLQVSCRGEELGNDGEDDWDSAGIHQLIEAQEDELEQWILGDEGDVEMEDAEDESEED